ncbi:uncharacterized protein LOC112512996 [Cynara cardunculus var. scolymus]|uniref:uncharacterized protein LOC112512996 n=1 Tax=Cynara cardunculus var. scolymus TaxID=59895 RepID=UPI000D625D06|nr:uncharacterized protein LOC112512996 [Cynara cardunculus var. scolymus]
MFQMLQTNGQYAGLYSEDPHSHLRSFMEIIDSFLIPDVSKDALRLKLFPFSLRDRARAWYNSLLPDSVTTWNEMAEKFLKKYFPPTRNAKSRNEICTFRQLDDEAVPDAWERYKELQRKCPHHGIPYCIQLETFYNSLNIVARQMLDATAGGAFTVCTYNEGFYILEKISNNNGQWSDPRAMPLKKTAGINEVDAVSALTAQITKLISNLTSSTHVQSDANAFNSNVQTVQCVYCGEGHYFEHCPGNPEHVNYVNKTGPFSQTYNPGWRNHPNFSWHSPALNPPMQKPQG